MGQKKFVAIDLSQEEEQQVSPKPPKAPKVKEAEPVLSESGSPAVVLSKEGKDVSHLVEDAEEPKKDTKSPKSPKTPKPTPEKVVPSVFDKNVVKAVSEAVKKAAREDGVARI